MSPTQVELGCGPNKRPGFFGIDKFPAPGLDLVLDIETQRLPFPDDSVEHIYSSHMFEHLEHPGSPLHPLREIVRVAKDGALVEIWTPHGASDDGLLLGHRNFYTETTWRHVCHLYPDFYLRDAPGRFAWKETRCVIEHGVLDRLEALHIPLDFALRHLRNITLEFGVFLEVRKADRAGAHLVQPAVKVGYSRQTVSQLVGQPPARPAPPQPPPASPPPEPPLRYRLVDSANDTLKAIPGAHRVVKSVLRALTK